MEGLGGKQGWGARYKISKESIMNYIIKKKNSVVTEPELRAPIITQSKQDKD